MMFYLYEAQELHEAGVLQNKRQSFGRYVGKTMVNFKLEQVKILVIK